MEKHKIALQYLPSMSGEITITPLGDGHINDTYLVERQQFRFVLQRINHHVFTNPEAVQRNAMLVHDHLKQCSYPFKLLRPLATHAVRFLVEDGDGNFWRAFPFFKNTFSPEGKISPEIAFEAARAVGVFLEKMSDFPAEKLAETIPGFHDTERRWAVFEDVFSKNPVGRNALAEPEIAALFAQKHLFEHLFQLKKSGQLPIRATHNDPKAGNVLLDISTKKAVAVIDWDTIMPGTIPSDFGDMMRSFATNLAEDIDPETEKMTLNLPVVEAMCRGFLEGAGPFLTEIERENLFAGGQWIIFEQALRFLTDFLAGDVYYKTSFPAHNLVRARNQLALLREVGRAEGEIRGFLEG